MSKPKILIVDDKENVRSFLRPALENAGYECLEAEDGLEAVFIIDEENPDVIVLDYNLKDRNFSGLDICINIRGRGIHTPVIFLTIEDRITDSGFLMDRVFDQGGDDFLTKREEILQADESSGYKTIDYLKNKSDVRELLSRIAAHLTTGRTPEDEPSENWFGDGLYIDLDSGDVRVKRNDEWVGSNLTGAELQIMTLLVKNKKMVCGRDDIKSLLGKDNMSDSSLENYISKIRQKIEPDPSKRAVIETRPNLGYRFLPPEKGI